MRLSRQVVHLDKYSCGSFFVRSLPERSWRLWRWSSANGRPRASPDSARGRSSETHHRADTRARRDCRTPECLRKQEMGISLESDVEARWGFGLKSMSGSG